MEGKIVITKSVNFPKGFDVEYDGKVADGLGFDEMMGLVASISMPENRPCLQWLKTPEQKAEWENKYL